MADSKPERTPAPEAKDYHARHINKEKTEDNTDTQSGHDMGAGAPQGKFSRFIDWYKTHKKISLPITAGLLLVLFFAIPVTRYAALGLVMKQEFSVMVVDSQSGRPVSSAVVELWGKSANTDAQGKAAVRVPVGQGTLTVTKAHYKTASQKVVVPIWPQKSPLNITLEATGRPVPVTVLNSITRKPVAGVMLTAGDSKAETDDKGRAILVVPVGEAEVAATLSADGYNKTEVTLKATTEEDEANTFTITPAGKIYFLSNASGTIDVVKSNLDGTEREVVVAGTGKEDRSNTVLLATRDWRYLALLSKRDGGNYAKLFLIDTSDGSLTNMDEGEAGFSLVGWEDHKFVYWVDRENVKNWEPKKRALKSFDADAKKLRTLDQTEAEGTAGYDYLTERYTYVNIVDGAVVFAKVWDYSGYDARQRMGEKSMTINAVAADGSNKRTIKSFPHSSDYFRYLTFKLGGHNQIYVSHYESNNNGAKYSFYLYKNGKLDPLPNLSEGEYDNLETTTYLQSPSKKQLFWFVNRDGKRVFFVGDPNSDLKSAMTLSTDYQAYGWLTDDYVLLTKNGSELYIAPASGVGSEDELLKVTDYYKPDYSYYGYGGGYGGL